MCLRGCPIIHHFFLLIQCWSRTTYLLTGRYPTKNTFILFILCRSLEISIWNLRRFRSWVWCWNELQSYSTDCSMIFLWAISNIAMFLLAVYTYLNEAYVVSGNKYVLYSISWFFILVVSWGTFLSGIWRFSANLICSFLLSTSY